MDELEFITRLRALATTEAARGLSDDAAVLDIGRTSLVLTHDTMVEGVHFLPDQDPADVAWKLVATNLSDLAAKGARPIGVLLSHMLGRDDARFADGLAEALAAFDVDLLGGDTVRSPNAPRTVGMTAIGQATHTPVPSRAGAQEGDSVFVTGPIGAAMVGFEAMDAADSAQSLAYRRPTPLIEAGIALAPHVSAMMDISDGLLLDTWRLASASDVTITLDPSAIPVADRDRLDACLRWGDDYQLLFTLPPGTRPPVEAHTIGYVTRRGDAPLLLGEQPFRDSADLGYTH